MFNFLKGEDYKQQYLDFIRNEKRRSNIMTKARIQPFCRANKMNFGYFDGERVFLRSVTNRDNALFLYNIHFCLIWKSEGVSFNQAIKELKEIFKIVDTYITNENINCYFKYEYKPKKIESHLSHFIVYNFETRNTDRARPNAISFYRSSKNFGRYERDQFDEELDKCRTDAVVLDGDKCVETALDFCLKLKGDEQKVKNKMVEYNLQLHAHKGSGFDTWIVLNILSCDIHIVNIIMNGKGIIGLKIFNGYKENKKDKFLNIFIFKLV